MSSTYSNLKFEIIEVGGSSGAWGGITNTNIGTAIEQSIVGMATLATGDFISNTATLTATNTNAAQNFRAYCLNITATLTAAGTVEVPAIQKPYLVLNNSVGGYAVTVKVAGQTGVAIPNGKGCLVYNNGTDVGAAITHLTSLTLATPLPVTSGGTGTSTPALVQGANITITGTWPNQTISSSYPNAGIAYSTGSAWGTSYSTSGSGTTVALTTSPTFVTPALGTPASGTLSNCTVDGTNEVGYKIIPQNSQSADYTTVLADSGKYIYHPATDANARTFTIPANASVAYPIGTAISFVNMTANDVTIAITSDTMYSSTGSTGSRTLAQYGSATALKMTSTTWLITGSNLT